MPRARTPRATETDVLVARRRRCAQCFGLNGNHQPQAGQLAHVDRNASNSAATNLAWLCLVHHDEYDTRRSQSKGFSPDERRAYREELYTSIRKQRAQLEPGRTFLRLSPEGLALASLLNQRSRNGYKCDPQIRIDALEEQLELSTDDIELAADEPRSIGLLEINGSRDVVFATNRLFWETDPMFEVSDPAADAEVLARALVGLTANSASMGDVASLLSWAPRRLNPAASYLVETGNANGVQTLGSAPYWYHQLSKSVAAKRYVRDLDRAQ